MSESKQKIVVVTGCSSGIGYATALLLAKDSQARFKVYATMRNLDKRGELEKNGSEVLGKMLFLEKLDVANEDNINHFVEEILKKEGRIDVIGKCLSFLSWVYLEAASAFAA